jgi:histidinol-phosphatase
MSAWDVAALVVCVREAGGSVSDFAGSEDNLLQAPTFIAANTATLRRAMCRRLTPA